MENLVQGGGIRVGYSTDEPARWVAANFRGSGNDSYILQNSSIMVWTFDKSGSWFPMNAEVVFAHELGHSTGSLDTVNDIDNRAASDALLNSENYDYAGDTLRFENQVATELGVEQQRVSYAAALTASDPRFAFLSSQESYTYGEQVSIVRFGDQATGNFANDIDFSGWSSNPDVLAFGFTGEDQMTGSGGRDFFYGGTGDDVLQGLGGDDFLHGEDGENVLDGGAGSDHLYGGNLRDTIAGGADGDYLYGGDGNDTIDGNAGDDIIYGDAGSDSIAGGSGFDTVDYSTSGPVRIEIGGGGLVGSMAGDYLDSDGAGDEITGVEHIIGSSYHDYLQALDTGMTLDGGDGDDELHGGSGADHLDGGDGYDSIYGGAGDDILFTDGSDLVVDGGEGDDTINVAADTSSVVLNGGEGDDTINIESGTISFAFNAGNEKESLNLSQIISDANPLFLRTDFDMADWSVTVDLDDATAELQSYDLDNGHWTVLGSVLLKNGDDELRIGNALFAVDTVAGDSPFSIENVLNIRNDGMTVSDDPDPFAFGTNLIDLSGVNNPYASTPFDSFHVI